MRGKQACSSESEPWPWEASKLRKCEFRFHPKLTYWLVIPKAGGSTAWWLRQEPRSVSEPVLILPDSVSVGRLYPGSQFPRQ